MEIKDNTFSRQFETYFNEHLVTLEYSFQDKKIFLTRLNLPDGFDNEEFITEFLSEIMQIATENKWKVVPVFPKIAAFFRKNPVFKSLLPPGIRL